MKNYTLNRAIARMAAALLLVSASLGLQAQTVKICSASDLHYFSPSLLINDGVAFQTYLASDRKLIAESKAITESLVQKMLEEKPEILLIPGDLTKDGEKISHQELATYLKTIESNGVTKVFVVPGNHDVNNVHAYSYNGNTQSKVSYVTPKEFKTIYKDFGYGEAISLDPSSLSYLAKPKAKVWVMGIDVCKYDQNVSLNEPVTAGRFKPKTYQWVMACLAEAKRAGATVIGMMHHGVTEHYNGQSQAFAEYVVEGWDTIAPRLADAGLTLMFTGHYHANDISKKTSGDNFIFDIETGSMVTYPCPYRVMELYPGTYFNIQTKTIDTIAYNTNGLDFQSYAKNYLVSGLTGIVKYVLMNAPYSLDAATAEVMTPHVVAAYVAHYSGDEAMPATEQAFISYLASIGQATFAGMLTSLWTDLTPEDNNLLIDLVSGNSFIPYASSLSESEYTVPTWTLLKRAQTAYQKNKDTASLYNYFDAVQQLMSKEMPYNVCISMNGDPRSQFGFSWFTNLGIENGEVQILEGKVKDDSQFEKHFGQCKDKGHSSKGYSFLADTVNIYNLNYNNSRNNLSTLAGFANNSKRSYTSHKAVATGLKANKVYSYRVGKAGAWSPVGHFTTANHTKGNFSFMYITDTQAKDDDYFSVTNTTVTAAKNMLPNAKFCMVTGDLVESSGSSNSEWEWEQWFGLMQSVWKNTPIAPIVGNHDVSVNKNYTHHFNTAKTSFDQKLATSPGGVYSFVYGDALFIAMTTEDYRVPGYLDSLKLFITKEVNAYPHVKWKFAFYHRTIYTGSSSHQDDTDGKLFRSTFIPLFDTLGIDIAFQGHDHIYEVIGVTRNYALVDGSVMGVDSVSEGGVKENMTGKQGGVFNVQNGTLFFLNNCAGKKKYYPRSQAQMEASYAKHGITNYYGLFTGKFGQPDLATFSDVKVTHDTVFISTYTVDGEEINEYDSFKVIKEKKKANSTQDTTCHKPKNWFKVYPNPAKSNVYVDCDTNVEEIAIYNSRTGEMVKMVKGQNSINVSTIKDGIYTLKIKSGNNLYVEQLKISKH